MLGKCMQGPEWRCFLVAGRQLGCPESIARISGALVKERAGEGEDVSQEKVALTI